MLPKDSWSVHSPISRKVEYIWQLTWQLASYLLGISFSVCLSVNQSVYWSAVSQSTCWPESVCQSESLSVGQVVSWSFSQVVSWSVSRSVDQLVCVHITGSNPDARLATRKMWDIWQPTCQFVNAFSAWRQFSWPVSHSLSHSKSQSVSLTINLQLRQSDDQLASN